ncbi:glycoside hydrolase family 97 C-terminal domain-containing protein, partial [Dysgonomonas gadei]|uniref:glycoside hydrolase family 97 C-terminal domain-containing protein n=1 Tax=Dysgonomonas gadei TaxID=156974 RepID=UPI003AEF2877
NSKARTLTITLDFLGKGDFTAEVYTDAEDVSINPNHLKKQIKQVKKGDTIKLPLASDGGAVIHIYPR